MCQPKDYRIFTISFALSLREQKQAIVRKQQE